MELALLRPQTFPDERGYFLELFRSSDSECSFVQDNLSFSKKNVVRGLHFQSSPGQVKLVTCLKGAIWDVAVDLRPNSPTFMQWRSFELSEDNHHQLLVPIGFAHGFCALTDALVLYKVSAPYDPKTEVSIRWNDPAFKIAWPVQDPILSPRDRATPFYHELAPCYG
jgi:dTDP-4-dehydrorhamnose 3,5-epimerase